MLQEQSNSESGIFAVCDVQRDYGEQIFRMLSSRMGGSYEFHLFHDPDRMKEFLRERKAEAVLAGEEYEKEFFEGISAAQKIVLTEDPQEGKKNGFPSVFRYQSADHIAGRIGRILGKEEKKSRVRIRDEPLSKRSRISKRMIGVYSPVHRIGNTTFAFNLGKKLSRDMPVLYISMEGYSGGQFLSREESDSDLGDLLYVTRQERGDHGLMISTMAKRAGSLDYILPMKNELDMRNVSAKEWMALLDLILEKCIYETIILDLGDAVNGLYDILKRCAKVYTLYIEEETAQQKLMQYEQNLKTAGYMDILRRTVKRRAGVARAGQTGAKR